MAPSKYDPDKFMTWEQVKIRFVTPFTAAYKTLTDKQCSGPAPELLQEPFSTKRLSSESIAADGVPAVPASSKPTGKSSEHGELKQEIECEIAQKLRSMVVCLTKDGQHEELVRSVASTELYQALSSESARFMGLYDVKNARLCHVHPGESVFQREPPIDQDDFETFANVMDSLMKPGCDVFWIACGTHESSFTEAMKVFS